MKKQLHYKESLEIKRLSSGVLSVDAKNIPDLFFGQGYAQAFDRSMQIILMRIIGQGRICELLMDSEDNLKVDIFFRKMNWNSDINNELDKLSKKHYENLEAWCAGIHCRLQEKIPWECKLLRIKVEPWKISDCILFMRMMGYVNLQQSQTDMETMIIQMIQNGVPIDYLQQFFGYDLQNADVELIKKIRFCENITPQNIVWKPWISSTIASNNWVISGSKTPSGKPILASDPHLEGNRLPNIWQEMLLKYNDRYLVGAGVPGIPGILIGRNNDVSWGATYSFMDSVDSWVELCKDEKYYKDGEWHNLTKRKETIKRKKKSHKDIIFYENDHGIIEGYPVEEGRYLATYWASGKNTGAKTLSAMIKLLEAKSAPEAMEYFGEIEVSFNWVTSDTQNNIGYQMSGLCPIRNNWSGLYPIDGTTSDNDWQGFYHHEKLPRMLNPQNGFIVTANNNLNHLGEVNPINLPMGKYRAQTIEKMLQELDSVTTKDCIDIQYNVISLEAQKFMDILKPILDDSPGSAILKIWDCGYDLHSKGAWLFEQFYHQLLRDVFCVIGGENVVNFLDKETSIIVDFYANFDDILLQEKSLWFKGQTREKIFKEAIKKSISHLKASQIKTWKSEQNIELTNITFASKLPKWLGFDYGPVAIMGGRATIHQGQIYKNSGRSTSFIPSLRMIIDMSLDGIESHLLGGPSDRRFSRHYTSEVDMWLNRRYKKLDPTEP